MLSIKNLHASFEQTPILQGVDLDVQENELHLILGLNGSGKSTLGKVLLGSPNYTQTDGTIFFYSEEISELETFERARKGLFLTHQSPPAIEGVSAKDLLRAADKAKGKDEKTEGKKRSIIYFKKELKKNLGSTGLSPKFIERNMNEGASGGERKKMEIASLLTLGATFAFFDEIDSGLDIDALKSVSMGINTFLEQEQSAAILVSHSAAILQYVSPTHVHVFKDGQIVKSGGIELADYVHKNGYEGI